MKVAHRIRVAYVKSIEWLGLMEFDLVGTSPQKLDTLVNRHFRQCAKRHHPDHHMSKPAAHQEEHAERFANCKFARVFLKEVHPKYGSIGSKAHEKDVFAFYTEVAGRSLGPCGQLASCLTCLRMPSKVACAIMLSSHVQV